MALRPEQALIRLTASGHRDRAFDVASHFAKRRSGPSQPVVWSEYKGWTQGDRNADRSNTRDEKLERWCEQLWRQVLRRGGNRNSEDAASTEKGPAAGRARHMQGTDVVLLLRFARRDDTNPDFDSQSLHPSNLISLDRVAGLYGRGVLDPKSCIRPTWPYGPPPDVASELVRTLCAVIDGFSGSPESHPGRWWKRIRLHAQCSLHDCGGRCQSTSTAAMRPIEMEETYRAEQIADEKLVGPLGDLSTICEIVGLTNRQTDVLMMALELQMSGRQIARALDITQPTAHEHLTNALQRCRDYLAARDPIAVVNS